LARLERYRPNRPYVADAINNPVPDMIRSIGKRTLERDAFGVVSSGFSWVIDRLEVIRQIGSGHGFNFGFIHWLNRLAVELECIR